MSKYDPNYRFVIVDNESTEYSYEKMKNQLYGHPNVFFLRTYENIGYAKGNNMGLRKAIEIFDPEYVAIMNPDVLISDGSLISEILKAMGKHPEMFLCTGLMLDCDRRLDYKKVAWKIPEGFDDLILSLPFFGTRLNPVCYKEFHVDEMGLAFVEVVPGSFFVARVSHFIELGFFDENTFLYCEERILGHKARIREYRIGLIMGHFFVHNHIERAISLSCKIKAYKRVSQSRIYYNKIYNKTSKIILMPLLYISLMVGFLLTIIAHIRIKLRVMRWL